MEATNQLSNKAERQLTEYRDKIKDITKLSDAPSISFNPFTPELGSVIEMKRKRVGKEQGMGNVTIIDDKTGAINPGEETKVFYEKKYVDDDKFIKIYQGQLKAMFALSGGGIKVFGYFIYQMQGITGKDIDMIYFNVQECMEFCQYKVHNQVYNGIIELIKKEFIAVAPRNHHYYINPMYIFNGNRVMIYQEFIRKDSLTRASEQKQLGRSEVDNNDDLDD